jgi:hypothetical protein
MTKWISAPLRAVVTKQPIGRRSRMAAVFPASASRRYYLSDR